MALCALGMKNSYFVRTRALPLLCTLELTMSTDDPALTRTSTPSDLSPAALRARCTSQSTLVAIAGGLSRAEARAEEHGGVSTPGDRASRRLPTPDRPPFQW